MRSLGKLFLRSWRMSAEAACGGREPQDTCWIMPHAIKSSHIRQIHGLDDFPFSAQLSGVANTLSPSIIFLCVVDAAWKINTFPCGLCWFSDWCLCLPAVTHLFQFSAFAVVTVIPTASLWWCPAAGWDCFHSAPASVNNALFLCLRKSCLQERQRQKPDIIERPQEPQSGPICSWLCLAIIRNEVLQAAGMSVFFSRQFSTTFPKPGWLQVS